MKPTTIHRLQLSAAQLAVKLMARIEHATGSIGRQYWTSSRVVLEWIAHEPESYQQFVANRAESIRAEATCTWSYIAEEENPAEIAAIGANAMDLKDIGLWWQGPRPTGTRPKPELTADERDIVEQARKPCLLGVVGSGDRWIAERYSNFTRLVTSTAIIQKCVKKWRENVARKKAGTFKGISDDEDVIVMFEEVQDSMSPYASKKALFDQETKMVRRRLIQKCITQLTRSELTEGEMFWMRWAQRVAFADEIASCEMEKPIAAHSRLSRLAPFRHEDGALRVGGRLQQANLSYDEMFPVILPAKDALVRLLIVRAKSRTNSSRH